MRNLAAFIMRGRLQAVLVIAITAMLPVVNICSSAALSLVTLRQGGREGLLVMGLATGLAGVMLDLLAESAAPAVFMAVLFWLPLWILAVTLRSTISLARTLQLALLMAALALLGHAAYVGDTAAWGRTLLEQVLKPLLEQMATATGTQAQLPQIMDYLAPFVAGFLFANGLVSLLAGLLLGRWWQALLFNPGGFRGEFHTLRLDRQTALIAAAVFGLALTVETPVLAGLSLLFMAIYTLLGLAVLHGVVAKAKLAWGWLAGLYGLMLIAFPQWVMLLSLVGVVDAWVDFRGRIKSTQDKPG